MGALSFWGVVVDRLFVETPVPFNNRQNDDRFPADLVDDAIAVENDLPEIASPDFWDGSTRTRENREAADEVHYPASPTRGCFRFVASDEVTNIAHIPARSL